MPELQRKQATVMSADVAGYSLMMAEDDVGTLDALLACVERICQLVDGFGGRVVDAPGDNLLAEFPSELAALRCAIEVQRSLIERKRNRGQVDRMLFRIGLHSGQLLAHGSRLYGDVVNLASRLQAAATPGRVLLSETVAQRVGSTLERDLVDRGQQRFKNIPYAVQTLETAPALGI
jgi:adenylate cyclase